MQGRPKALLINPPLWNVYAPHLAVPLLLGTLRSRGYSAEGLDLSIEHLDWLLAEEGLAAISDRLEATARTARRSQARELIRAFAVLPTTIESIAEARRTIADVDALRDTERYRAAARTIRNALWCVSAAFPGTEFDLRANNLYYSARSTEEVLRATTDPDRNVYRWAFEQCLPTRLDDSDVALVGLSVSADTQLVAALTVARMVKERRPDVHVTVGGNFATRIALHWTTRHPFFDLVDDFVLYEGEEAIVQLCERELAGRSTGSISGLVEATADGGLRRTPPAEVPLDGLARPDYDDFPLHSYFAPGPVLPLFASRSCAWKCAFCSIPFASNSFRARPAEQVVDDFEALSERYGTRYFMLVDEILTVPTMRKLTREIIDRGTNCYWYGETRFAQGITPELAADLYASGCRRLDFGLESYNQRVLDLMQKGTKVEHIEPNIEALLGAGVPVHLFCIAGFPGEREAETQRTVAFVDRIMRRAREEFGNPYCTFKIGPFIMDLLSPVGSDPDAFGVGIEQPPPEEDLALSAAYSVDGRVLQPAEATALARAVDSPWLASRGGGWRFHDGVLIGDAEEVVFLSAVLGVPIPAGASPSPPRSRVVPFEPASVWRPPDLTVVSADYSLHDDESRPCLVLYRAATDAVWSLDLRCAEALSGEPDDAGRGASEVSSRDNTVTDTIWTLVRLGFLETDGAIDLARVPCPLVARQTPEIVVHWHDGSLELESRITGRRVRLNTAAAALWEACADGIPFARPLDHEGESRTSRRAKALQQLIELGFAYAEPEQPNAAQFVNRPAALATT